MAFTYVPGVNTYTTGSGNQMGPGGPGGEFYDDKKNDPVVTYTSPGYTGSGSQADNQGTGQSGQVEAETALQDLIDKKNLYQYLYLDPNDPRNEYQKMMHALMTGGTYASPGGVLPSGIMGLPQGMTQGQIIPGMNVTGSDLTSAAYDKKFPLSFNRFMADKLPQALGNTWWGKMLGGLGQGKKDNVVAGTGGTGIAQLPGQILNNIKNQFNSTQKENINIIGKEGNNLPESMDFHSGTGGIAGFSNPFNKYSPMMYDQYKLDQMSGITYDPSANPYPVGSLKYTQKQIELMKDKYGSDGGYDFFDEQVDVKDELGKIAGQFNLADVSDTLNITGTDFQDEEKENVERSLIPGGVGRQSLIVNQGSDTSALKDQIMSNPGTTTFGAIPGQTFNVFDPDAYLQGNPITQDMIQTGIIGQANGGYLKQYDDGGYAKMSTFEKLKMMADNYGQQS